MKMIQVKTGDSLLAEIEDCIYVPVVDIDPFVHGILVLKSKELKDGGYFGKIKTILDYFHDHYGEDLYDDQGSTNISLLVEDALKQVSVEKDVIWQWIECDHCETLSFIA